MLLPASLVFTWFALAAAVYLSFVGLSVPAAVLERHRVPARRCGGRCSSAAPTGCTRSARSPRSSSSSSSRGRCSCRCCSGQADETIRVAIFLADVVLAPLMLLGTAMLYFDQAARVGIDRKRRGRAADAEIER